MTQDHSSERAQLSDERIAFEAWCQCLWNKDRLATEKGIFSDWYRDSEIDGMWGAWQARAAIAADRATATATRDASPSDAMKPRWVKRDSDFSVTVVFASCRLASEFERQMTAAGGCWRPGAPPLYLLRSRWRQWPICAC
jgi:hypothetical protein